MVKTSISNTDCIEHDQSFKTQPKYFSTRDDEGKFDLKIKPLTPPDTKVTVNEKPNISFTWDQHGVQGWYIGPEVEHY